MFYDQFVDLCDQKGVSPTFAALEIGLSKATPTKWKKERSIPKGETLKKVAAYFGVTESQLLTDERIQLDSTADSQNVSFELREELRNNYAFRVLWDTMDGATDADILEAAAIIARRKEERSKG